MGDAVGVRATAGAAAWEAPGRGGIIHVRHRGVVIDGEAQDHGFAEQLGFGGQPHIGIIQEEFVGVPVVGPLDQGPQVFAIDAAAIK